MKKQDKEVLTISEVAEYLSVTDRTIRHWIFTNKIPYMRLNKYIRFKKSEIEKWLKSKEIKNNYKENN